MACFEALMHHSLIKLLLSFPPFSSHALSSHTLTQSYLILIVASLFRELLIRGRESSHRVREVCDIRSLTLSFLLSPFVLLNF
jgi:hypothetical protein